MVNDDADDDLFLDAPARLSAIVEDAKPTHLPRNEY
jgi:D-lyxose ketol-isomerase